MRTCFQAWLDSWLALQVQEYMRTCFPVPIVHLSCPLVSNFLPFRGGLCQLALLRPLQCTMPSGAVSAGRVSRLPPRAYMRLAAAVETALRARPCAWHGGSSDRGSEAALLYESAEMSQHCSRPTAARGVIARGCLYSWTAGGRTAYLLTTASGVSGRLKGPYGCDEPASRQMTRPHPDPCTALTA